MSGLVENARQEQVRDIHALIVNSHERHVVHRPAIFRKLLTAGRSEAYIVATEPLDVLIGVVVAMEHSVGTIGQRPLNGRDDLVPEETD